MFNLYKCYSNMNIGSTSLKKFNSDQVCRDLKKKS